MKILYNAFLSTLIIGGFQQLHTMDSHQDNVQQAAQLSLEMTADTQGAKPAEISEMAEIAVEKTEINLSEKPTLLHEGQEPLSALEKIPAPLSDNIIISQEQVANVPAVSTELMHAEQLRDVEISVVPEQPTPPVVVPTVANDGQVTIPTLPTESTEIIIAKTELSGPEKLLVHVQETTPTSPTTEKAILPLSQEVIIHEKQVPNIAELPAPIVHTEQPATPATIEIASSETESAVVSTSQPMQQTASATSLPEQPQEIPSMSQQSIEIQEAKPEHPKFKPLLYTEKKELEPTLSIEKKDDTETTATLPVTQEAIAPAQEPSALSVETVAESAPSSQAEAVVQKSAQSEAEIACQPIQENAPASNQESIINKVEAAHNAKVHSFSAYMKEYPEYTLLVQKGFIGFIIIADVVYILHATGALATMTDIIKNNPRKSTTLALVTAAILGATEYRISALSTAFDSVVMYALTHPYIAAFVAISPLLAHNACKIIATKKGRLAASAITGSAALGYLTLACAELGDDNPIRIEDHAQKIFDMIKSFLKASPRAQLAVTAITASAIGCCYMMYKRITNNTKRKILSLIKAGDFIQAQEIIRHTIPGYFNKQEAIRLINEYQHQYSMANDITSLYCRLEEIIPS